jgi:hypothetical protein
MRRFGIGKQHVLFHAVIALLVVTGCKKKEGVSIETLTDVPQLLSVDRGSVSRYVSGYGIALGSGAQLNFEVSIDAKNSTRVQAGQFAEASLIPISESISCRVTRVVRQVNQETGQALAWLKPENPAEIPSGEFVAARIKTDSRRDVVLVPKKAVLIRDGNTWLIQKKTKAQGNSDFLPVQVQLGVESGDQVEVVSGIEASDEIVTQGGMGLLSPSFRQKGSSD